MHATSVLPAYVRVAVLDLDDAATREVEDD